MSIHLRDDLNLTVAGQRITHHQLCGSLAALPTDFTRADFEASLAAQPVAMTVNAEVTRRVMQHLRRRGIIQYDRPGEMWRIIAPRSSFAPDQTLPLTIAPDAPTPLPLPEPATIAKPARIEAASVDLRSMAQISLAHLACVAIVVALVTINAGFAWELAENEAFRFAFVAGLMACDLMRPLLVARGLHEFDRRRAVRGCAAILVAISLAPVSVLSSTSVIGATLHLGGEENDQAAARAASLEALHPEHERLKALSAELWQAHREECARGGCGPIATGLRAKAEAADLDAARTLKEIASLTGAGEETSAFIARTVKSFSDLGLYGPDRAILIPLLLALTLEVAALFGPGLLLTERKVNRATR